MNKQIFETQQLLREQLIDIMLNALEKEGGIYLTREQRNRLSNDLAHCLMGTIQV